MDVDARNKCGNGGSGYYFALLIQSEHSGILAPPLRSDPHDGHLPHPFGQPGPGPAVRILLKRVMSDPALSAASQKVMSWLLLEGRDEAPGASDMARFVGLTERSVRRVYQELKEAGWLDPERGWSEAPRADTPERAAILDGIPERTEMSATFDLPGFREYIAMLEVIRDRALAKGREDTALCAQHKIGRALGYDRPERRADRNVRPEALPRRQPGEGLGGGGEVLIDRAKPSPPPPRPSPELTLEGGRHELASAGAEQDPMGTDMAEAGSNWLELAGLGYPENQAIPEKLRPISDLLAKPIFAAETTEAGRRPSWLNGVSAAALASGQNCPPAASDVR